ncbi:MAG: hypothetical protein AAGA75_00040 [Cyanobacteria bacterium P01_E01_bin.6]
MVKRKLTLEAVNQRLRASAAGLVVMQRGERLYLRGTLPPKPGSGKLKAHQQEISLKIYANPAGLEYAESKAMELGALIAQKRFSWLEVQGDRHNADSCQAWIEAFKKYALQNLIKTTGEQAEIDWKERFWYPAFTKLNPKSDLTADAIILAVQKTKVDSRSRQVCCQRMNKLAEFAGIKIDLKPYQGNYNPRNVDRDIPSDEEIEKAIDSMKNPEWKHVAAMMATYGLRDHEVWFAKVVSLDTGDRTVMMCEITDGKTGARKSIPPLPPEWAERWELAEGSPPNLKVRTNKEYGDRTARAFTRQKNPHKPYSYRHAFAIRAALKYGFPTAVSAKWLGHDPSVYLSTYQKHISEAQATEAFLEKIE